MAIVLIIGAQLIGLVKTYPYYLDYYNALVGGPAKVYVNRNYQISWWGEGLFRAGQWLNTNGLDGSSVSIKALPNHSVGTLKSGLVVVKDEQKETDYIVENPNYSWYKSYRVPENYQLVFQEKVAGAPLVSIWKKK